MEIAELYCNGAVRIMLHGNGATGIICERQKGLLVFYRG